MALQGLAGKSALVTGGGQGIGLATAMRLVEEGARVMLVDRDADLVNGAMESLGSAASGVVADVSTEAGVAEYTSKARDAFGRADLVHLNAGIEGQIASFSEAEIADYDRVQAVNVRGVFLGLRAALRMMDDGRGGAIVITASLAGQRGEPEFGAYVASKHAVIGLTRTAAIEAGHIGVRVNAVAPGQIDTRMMVSIAQERAPGREDEFRAGLTEAIPLGRYGSPGEVGSVVAWLLSEDASFVSGATVPVDGGVSVL